MASVSCLASGVVHCLSSSLLAAVVDRLCCRRLDRLEQRTFGNAGLAVRRKLRAARGTLLTMLDCMMYVVGEPDGATLLPGHFLMLCLRSRAV